MLLIPIETAYNLFYRLWEEDNKKKVLRVEWMRIGVKMEKHLRKIR